MLIEYVIGTQQNTVLFPFPPDEDYPEGLAPKDDVVEAITGQRQVTNYAIVETLFQKFSGLSFDFVNGDLKAFFRRHALLGRDFRYYILPTVPNPSLPVHFSSSNNWHLDKRVFLPKKQQGTIDRYSIEFTLRRV